jgi:uncharacterized membrane protein
MPAHRHALPPARSPASMRAVAVVLAAAVIGTVTGLVLLWPGAVHHTGLGGQVVQGTVTSVGTGCEGQCVAVTVAVRSGPDRGTSTQLTFERGATNPQLRAGEHIRMQRSDVGATVVYLFADIRRTVPMGLLAVLFALVVLVVGRLRGLAAMLGLAWAGVVLVVFVIPALLDGRSPTLVALAGGGAIVLVVLPLAHGVSASTGAALLGTLAGMALAALLSMSTVHALHFTGTSGEDTGTLAVLGSHSTVAGLLLCGSVVGALGVLNDVTVTQAVAVFELAATDESATRSRLFSSGMRIGRDHIASTVYSLVLAYAGSALPLLLLFSITGQAVGDVLTSDALGPEIVAGLIGATSLVLVVPLTTAIAATTVPRR